MDDEVETIQIEGSISNIMTPQMEDKPEKQAYVEPPPLPPMSLDDMLDEVHTPPKFSPLDLNDAEREHRRKQLKKIKLYTINYKFLDDVDIVDLTENQPNERLDYVVEDIEFQLSSRKSFEPALMGYKLGCMGLENMSMKMGMKTKGLATICTTDDAILDTFREVMIKYDGSMNVPCEYRLAFAISMTMFQLHAQNKEIENIKKQANETENFAENTQQPDELINNSTEMFNDL